MSDPTDEPTVHPPGCECGAHPLVEPGGGLGRLSRQLARMLGTLSPAEQAILRARMGVGEATGEADRAEAVVADLLLRAPEELRPLDPAALKARMGFPEAEVPAGPQDLPGGPGRGLVDRSVERAQGRFFGHLSQRPYQTIAHTFSREPGEGDER